MKTDKIERDEILESSAPKEKIKELGALAFFTLLAAVSSVIIMDAIAFPVTLFAVKNKNAYNIIFKYSFLAAAAFSVIYMIFNRAYRMKKDGFSASNIIIYLLKKPFSYTGTAAAMILISAALIFLIYMLLNLNYIFLSKITGI